MSIKEKLKNDMIQAMKAKEKDRLDAIRFIQAAVKKVEIDTRKDLDDGAVIGILANLAKQRRDSITEFKKGGRQDLVAKEESELSILQSYLPAQLSPDAVAAIVGEVIAATGAKGMKDMGTVIKGVMAKTAGQAEGSFVSELVKKALQG
jgi:uncharacterized protein